MARAVAAGGTRMAQRGLHLGGDLVSEMSSVVSSERSARSGLRQIGKSAFRSFKNVYLSVSDIDFQAVDDNIQPHTMRNHVTHLLR